MRNPFRRKPAPSLVDRVRVLPVMAGDTIVLTTDKRISRDAFEQIKASIEAADLTPGVKVILMEDGMDVKVLRESTPYYQRPEQVYGPSPNQCWVAP